MTDQLTQADFDKWIPARQVYAQVGNAMGAAATNYLMKRLCSGLLEARASHYFSKARKPRKDLEFSTPVDPTLWDILALRENANTLSDFWGSGDLELELTTTRPRATVTVQIFDVRLDPDGVKKLPRKDAPQGISLSMLAPAANHAGGAPRKEFWDRLWADIAARLYVGDLKPTKQAHIEKAMLDWAVSNDEGLSDQSARTRARIVWAAIKEKDKN